MKMRLGTIMLGGFLLAFCSPSQAQVNLSFGRGGSPNVSFGQPAYTTYPYAAGQPVYGQTYARPSYYPQAGYASPYAPRYYSSGYSGYAAPNTAYPPRYSQPGYAAPLYRSPYQQPTYYNGYSGYSQPANGTGLMMNGRMYTLPR